MLRVNPQKYIKEARNHIRMVRNADTRKTIFNLMNTRQTPNSTTPFKSDPIPVTDTGTIYAAIRHPTTVRKNTTTNPRTIYTKLNLSPRKRLVSEEPIFGVLGKPPPKPKEPLYVSAANVRAAKAAQAPSRIAKNARAHSKPVKAKMAQY